MDAVYEPYCGAAPVPSALWTAWNLDPLLLASLLALGLLGMRAIEPGRRERRWLAAGIAVLAVAFVSPLCALSSALFSARVFHHLLLVALAAPLLAMAVPGRRDGRAWPGGLTLPFLVHTALLWLWHAPAPYQWALSGHAAYWLMEISLLGSAVWLWRGILRPGAAAGPALFALLATVVQMGFLGALITFARAPLFAPHFFTTQPWGLSALQDQQIAGLMMWVPGALPYVAVALWKAAAFLRPAEGAWNRPT